MHPIVVMALGLLTLFPLKQNKYEQIVKTTADSLVASCDRQQYIWQDAGWWNSANVLTGLLHYAKVSGDASMEAFVDTLFQKTKAFPVAETATSKGFICRNYINDYYDDEGWWALAWIDAYSLYKTPQYLEMAETIFADMQTGWSDQFNGGIFWKKNPLHYKNAIANGLFSLTAARLYEATGKESYRTWFVKNVEWIRQSGMINEHYFVEDGLSDDGQPNRGNYYTYNQGVMMAVFAEMYRLTKEESYLTLAEKIAEATITDGPLSANGILKERTDEIAKSNDGVQFKGIFIRHLNFLYSITHRDAYKQFIIRNADAIMAYDYDPATHRIGALWGGPLVKTTSAARSSAFECLTAASQF